MLPVETSFLADVILVDVVLVAVILVDKFTFPLRQIALDSVRVYAPLQKQPVPGVFMPPPAPQDSKGARKIRLAGMIVCKKHCII